MTPDPIETLLKLIADRLRSDGELRDALLAATRRWLDPTPPPPESRPAPELPVRVGPVVVVPSSPAEPLPPLTFSTSETTASPSRHVEPPPPPAFDLKLMADRFAIKREGCEWHVERRRLLQRSDIVFNEEVGPHDKEVMDRARGLPGGCWMWMCRPETPTPEPQLMDRAARSYDNSAQAVLLTRDVLEDDKLAGHHEEAALVLLAEAMSATRVVLEEIGAPLDRDHKQVFEWLREQTSMRGIFIERYMKVDDPADPANWNDLSERIDAIRQRIQSSQATQQQQKQLLNTIRFHCQKLSTAAPGEAGGHWNKIVAACTELVRANVPPSNTKLRDLLVPVIDLLPGEQPATAEFELVLRSIDAYVASREADTPDLAADTPTADVTAVRGALAGKTVVLIGGVSRPAARERIRRAFDLREVLWPDTRVHESHYHFEPLIHRPDVAVVLLAIRWSGHAFGEVKDFCETADKPLVRLPAGYHPHAVAHEIIAQAGKRLGLSGVPA